MTSKLDRLRTMTTIVADTGDLAAVERLCPIDCTTNPTLVLKAIQDPASIDLVEDALRWGRQQAGGQEVIVSAIADRLSVSLGVKLAALIPGRVSTEVDADLSFDTQATVQKARTIIAAYEAQGVGRERILIKIAATWEGIEAVRLLQHEGIDCNVTLLFSLPQAFACAHAKAWLISPFVGRILDWHVKQGGGPYTPEDDPGVRSVKAIYAAYKAHGVETIVMGASFRSPAQIEALAGCDRLTIAPALLESLSQDNGPLARQLAPDTITDAPVWQDLDEAAFRLALNEDAMASEKLSEGIRLFIKDLRTLRALIARKLEA